MVGGYTTKMIETDTKSDEIYLEITYTSSFRKKIEDVRRKRRDFWKLIRSGKLKVDDGR